METELSFLQIVDIIGIPDTKKYVRKNFDKFVDSSTDFMFEFNKVLNITNEEISIAMLWSILLELDRWKFESVIIDFINNYDIYREHLEHWALIFYSG